MRNIGYFLLFSILLNGCDVFSDEKLTLQRTDYNGNELRMDGYYYKYDTSYDSSVPNRTICYFFFRNGISVAMGSYETIDLKTVEREMLERYKWLYKHKSVWGVFVINGNTFEEEGWSTSVGGGLPVARCIGIIENDTTIHITKHFEKNKEYARNYRWHFKQFSPKPDSTNNFIK